ncbi:MAG: hypothetical protein AABW48_00680 [Nanoarchaeota archaeon]
MDKLSGLGLAALLAVGVNSCYKQELVEEPQTNNVVLKEAKQEENSEPAVKSDLVSGIYKGKISVQDKQYKVTYEVELYNRSSDNKPVSNCTMFLWDFNVVKDEVYSLELFDWGCDNQAKKLSLLRRDYGISSIPIETISLEGTNLQESGLSSLATELLMKGRTLIKPENEQEYLANQEKLKNIGSILSPLRK